MPATFNGRPVVTFPASPAASSVDPTLQSITSSVMSPFTGQQQLQSWSAGWLEIDLTFPPMTPAQAAQFTGFLVTASGQTSVFTLPAWLQAYIPAGLAPSGYWSLKANANKFSINIGQLYGFQFVIREVVQQ